MLATQEAAQTSLVGFTDNVENEMLTVKPSSCHRPVGYEVTLDNTQHLYEIPTEGRIATHGGLTTMVALTC